MASKFWPIWPGSLAFKHCRPHSVQPRDLVQPYRNSINHDWIQKFTFNKLNS